MVRIFVDVDNVIADFQTPFRKCLNKKTGKKLKIEDIKEFDFYKDFQISQDLEKTYHKEFAAKNGYEELKIVKRARTGLRCLRRLGDVKYITARPIDKRDITYRWFSKHRLPIRPDSLVFSKDKTSYAAKYDIIVEDKWEDAILAAEKGKDVILFDYPWNCPKDARGNSEERENIIRVSGWKGAVDAISRLAEAKYKKAPDEHTLKVWKDSIDVQMHFNELIMRNRTVVSSIIVVALGAALSFIKLGLKINIADSKSMMLGDFIAVVALCGLVSYGVIDIGYYFRLLLGSVEFSENLELEYGRLGLTSSITKSIKHGNARLILVLHYVFLLLPMIGYLIVRHYRII